MDDKKVTMTIKEIKRVEVMTLVESGKLNGRQAAEIMKLSLRQTRRIIKKYRQGGAESLAHGTRGKPSHNRLDAGLVTAIKQHLQESYADYNSTHLVEILAERHGLKVSVSSLTRIRQEAGCPTPRQKKRRRYYGRRDRKPVEGEMLQADGSIHDWLEGRGPKLTLIAYIDDATNKAYAAFRAEEDAVGYMQVLQEICLTDGIPQSMYMDMRLASRKKATLEEQLAAEEPQSQFERILAELGIELILAHSPQAKGRIERLFETLQDRLVKALRQAGADSLESANAVLKIFLVKFNHQFMQMAKQDGSLFVPWNGSNDTDNLFVFKYRRMVHNDNTIHFSNQTLQLPPGRDRCSYAKAKVSVHQHLDGLLTVHYQGAQIACFEHKPGIPLRIGKFIPAYDYSNKENYPKSGKQINYKKSKSNTIHSPGLDHPWKQNYGFHLNGKLIQQNSVTESE